MDTLLFGISGLPLGNGFTKFSYASGIACSAPGGILHHIINTVLTTLPLT